MPKYQKSGRIKEFAFIEFEEKSSVEKCIQAFQQFNGVIGGAEGENLTSVSAYIKEQEELEKTEEGENVVKDENKENKANEEKPSESKSDEKNAEESLEAPSTSTNDDVLPVKRIVTDESDARKDEEVNEGEGEDFVPASKRMKLVEPESDKEETEDKDGEGDVEQAIEQDAEKEADGNTDDGQESKKKR